MYVLVSRSILLSGTPNVVTGDVNPPLGPFDLTDPKVDARWSVLPCRTVNHNCYDEGCADYQARVNQMESQFSGFLKK
jgi:hypothetical protein